MKLHIHLSILLSIMTSGSALAEPPQSSVNGQLKTAEETAIDRCLTRVELSPAAHDHLAQCHTTGTNPMPCYARGTQDEIVSAELSEEDREHLIACVSQASSE